MQSDRLAMLATFVARDQRQALAHGEPLAERARGAALFADITGFTPLTRAFCSDLGASLGAEELVGQLRQVFDRLIDAVHEFGGSVVAFNGDAITCWFEGAEAEASRRALAAALTMQESLAGRFLQLPGGQRFPASVKLAIAAGPVRRFIVGDPELQSLVVIAGATLERVAAVEQRAQGGELLLSAEVAGLLDGQLQLKEWREGAPACALVESASIDRRPAPWSPDPELTAEQLRPWISQTVFDELMRGHGEFIGGFRRIAVLFLNFSGIEYDADPEAGAQLDAFVRRVQQIAARLGAPMVDFTIGDKGSYLSLAFGALRAHEDDARRAVTAAAAILSIPRELQGVGPLCMGIAYAQAYAGAFGGSRRRTFGTLSDDVILAARLMSRAGPGEVLVAPEIARASRHWHEFEARPPIVLKGFSEPIQAHRLRGDKGPDAVSTGSVVPMVGRLQEQARCRALLAQLCSASAAAPRLVIEAEAGMGKTMLLASLCAMARAQGVQLLCGGADAIRSSVAYHAFRPVFESLLGLCAEQSPAERAAAVQAQLQARGEAELAPLLNPVLGLELPETGLSRQLEGPVRADNTNELLLRLLHSAEQPSALLLEDLHWLDSASATLLRLIIKELPAIAVFMARRPAITAQAEWRLPADVEQLLLGGLGADDIKTLLQQTLAAPSLPASLCEWVAGKAEGSPFFVRELALALRDAGVLEIEAGHCALAYGIDNLEALDFPDTVQGVIAARLDQLSSEEQMTVRVASVIGREFAVPLLRDVHPVPQGREALRRSLEALDSARIAQPLPTDGGNAYLFSHVLTQQVAYGRLLHEQRTHLHQAVGEWLEANPAAAGGPSLPLLAYHFHQAARSSRASPELREKALDYLTRAGERAVRGNMNREALRYFNDAIALAGDAQVARSAVWHAGLAHAYDALGDFPQSCAHSRRVFELRAQPFPDRSGGMLLNSIAQLARVLWRLLRRRTIFHAPGTPVQPAADNWVMDEPLRVLRVFSKSLWHQNDILGMLCANSRSLLRSASTPPGVEVALCYSYWQLTVDVFRMPALSDEFGRRALQMAVAAESPSAVVTIHITHGMVHLAHARWAEAEKHFDSAIRGAADIGDGNQWGEATAMLADMALFRGDLATGARLYAELHRNAQRRESILQQAWCLRPSALQAIAADDPGALLQTLAEFRHLLETTADPLMQIDGQGLQAWARWRLGQHHEMQQAIDAALELIPTVSPPVAYPRFIGFRALSEVCLSLYESDPRSRTRRQQAEFVVRSLQQYASGYVYARPRLELCQAWLKLIRGRRDAAERQIRKVLPMAEALSLQPELRLAARLLG